VLAVEEGIFYLDRFGRAVGLQGAKSSALLIGRNGTTRASRGFEHELGRASTNATGDMLSVIDFDGVLRVYDSKLVQRFEMNIGSRPEFRARAVQLQVSEEYARRNIRAAALAPDQKRVVFAAMDQLWCIECDGTQVWGLQLPEKEGWKRVVETTPSTAESPEVRQALEELGLQLPLQWEMVRKRYKELARQRHPDLNPSWPRAVEQMQSLNRAYEILTGVSPEDLLAELGNERVFYQQEMNTSESEIDVMGFKVKLTISTGVQLSEASVRDWIETVEFSGDGKRIYLASQSGRVLELDTNGDVVRVYGVGQYCWSLSEVGGRIYVGTTTRLYVLSNGELIGFEDIHDLGRVVVTSSGVILWDEKTVTWLGPDGKRVGQVATRDPVRRVICGEGGWVVQTRQHRAVVLGAPDWWGASEVIA
jgi:hypothetical protein